MRALDPPLGAGEVLGELGLGQPRLEVHGIAAHGASSPPLAEGRVDEVAERPELVGP
jgi:hypothetical protein